MPSSEFEIYGFVGYPMWTKTLLKEEQFRIKYQIVIVFFPFKTKYKI
jgi:hypothetical protein